MNTNGRPPGTSSVAASVSGLTRDVIELTELQAQLLALDLKKSSQRTRRCAILAIVGFSVLLGTIPVALYALAELLVEQLEWSRAAGLGVATLVGLVVAAALGWAAYSIVQGGLVSLQRSREEFNRNVAWLKSALSSQGYSSATEKSETTRPPF